MNRMNDAVQNFMVALYALDERIFAEFNMQFLSVDIALVINVDSKNRKNTMATNVVHLVDIMSSEDLDRLALEAYREFPDSRESGSS